MTDLEEERILPRDVYSDSWTMASPLREWVSVHKDD